MLWRRPHPQRHTHPQPKAPFHRPRHVLRHRGESLALRVVDREIPPRRVFPEGAPATDEHASRSLAMGTCQWGAIRGPSFFTRRSPPIHVGIPGGSARRVARKATPQLALKARLGANFGSVGAKLCEEAGVGRWPFLLEIVRRPPLAIPSLRVMPGLPNRPHSTNATAMQAALLPPQSNEIGLTLRWGRRQVAGPCAPSRQCQDLADHKRRECNFRSCGSRPQAILASTFAKVHR